MVRAISGGVTQYDWSTCDPSFAIMPADFLVVLTGKRLGIFIEVFRLINMLKHF